MSYLKKIRDLRKSLELKIDRQRQMADLLKLEDRDFQKSEQAEFDTLSKEILMIEKQISAVEQRKIEDKKFAATQAPKRPGGATTGMEKMDIGDNANVLGRAMIELKTGKPLNGFENRAITVSSGSALIQDPLVQGQVIDSLLSHNPLVRAGAHYFDCTNKTSFPKVSTYPTVQWMASGDQLAASEPTITSVDFNLKDVAVLVKVENNVLYDSTPEAAVMIQRTMEKAINQAILQAVFSGSGSKQPVGLDSMEGVQSFVPVEYLDFDFLIDGVTMLLNKNVPLENIGLIASPKVWSYLSKMKTGIENDSTPLIKPFDLSDMKDSGMLHITTAISDEYGTGSNESRIYMGDYSQLAIGMGGPYALTIVEKYSDYLQTGFQLHMRIDVQSYLSDNFVRIEGLEL